MSNLSQDTQRSLEQIAKTLQNKNSSDHDRIRQLELLHSPRQILGIFTQIPVLTDSILETTLGSVILPANILGETGVLPITFHGGVSNASGAAANLTVKLKLGSSSITLGPVSVPSNIGTSRLIMVNGIVHARGNLTSQYCTATIELTNTEAVFNSTFTIEGYNLARWTENTASDLLLSATAQWGTAAQTLILDPVSLVFGYPTQAVLG